MLDAALDSAGVENDFVVFPGAGHGFRDEDARAAVERTVAWFERHLLPGG
jgi:dipeptidyl aminopeptidase/acylaminoacyl peptidase